MPDMPARMPPPWTLRLLVVANDNRQPPAHFVGVLSVPKKRLEVVVGVFNEFLAPLQFFASKVWAEPPAGIIATIALGVFVPQGYKRVFIGVLPRGFFVFPYAGMSAWPVEGMNNGKGVMHKAPPHESKASPFPQAPLNC